MFKDLQELVIELNTTNKTNEKIEILKKYPQCKTLLMYTYNPFYQFNVTSANLKKRKDLNDNTILCNGTIIDVLDNLRERKVTGHQAIAMTNNFINNNKPYEDLVYKIIDKNLQTRTDAKLINKVFPKLVPQFNVALANKYEDYESKIDFEKEIWYASRKLDGVRCIIRKENGVASCWSRQGKQFETLKVLEDELLKSDLDDIVLDGEVCLFDGENEDFQGIMKQIRRKDHVIKNPQFKMFDVLTLEEFDNMKGNRSYKEREAHLASVDLILNSSYFTYLTQIRIKNKEHLTEMMEEATSKGWEGLIIRKDVTYEGKRTKNLLKVKKMYDAEYVVEELEFGSYRVINKETGLEETIQTLTNVFIIHRGNKVGVGSGFTLDERKKYYNNPELIKGKVVTIQYFEETKNQEGNYSLRFPVVKYIHGDKRDV